MSQPVASIIPEMKQQYITSAFIGKINLHIQGGTAEEKATAF